MDTTLKRAFLRALVVSLCATAGLAILTLFIGDFDETAGRIVATTAFISLYSLMALPGASLLDRRTHASLGWVTLLACGIALLLAMNLVWADWRDTSETSWKLVAIATVIAGAFAQASATTWRRRATDSSTLVRLYGISLVTGFALALMIMNALLNEVEDGTYYRVLGALAVANLLAALLQPVIRRMAPAATAHAPESELDGYRVVFTLDQAPSPEAVREATKAFVAAGIPVQSVEQNR
jgi:peptidoglycan/LPS O-acetylase OafA/YrhL